MSVKELLSKKCGLVMKRALKKISLLCCVALLLVSTLLFGCSTDQSTSQGEESSESSVRLQIYAANSLAKALDEAIDLYHEEYPNVDFFDVQYLSSGDLNAQLLAGGYSDILISASTDKMNQAITQGSIDTSSMIELFSNDLVVAARLDSDASISSLSDLSSGEYTFSIGDESVPAGTYARIALGKVGLYSNTNGYGGFFLGASPLLDSSVGNVCKHVANGDVDLGIVYNSDLYRYDELQEIYSIPKSLTGEIIYPAAVCSDSTQKEAAVAFLNWCKNDDSAMKIWQKWGFSLA